jgi:hypothetical protein
MSSEIAQKEELKGQMPPSDSFHAAPAAMEVQALSSDTMVVVDESAYRDVSLRPVFCLSVRLIDTYKHINKVVLCLLYVRFTMRIA